MKDEKMKDKEMWVDKLKEKLADYSEPTPSFGWERLEKELVSPVGKRMLYPYRRWAMAAAAVLLAVASSVSVYFLNSPVADEVRRTDAPALTSVPDVPVTEIEPTRVIRPVVAMAGKVSADKTGTKSPEPVAEVNEPVESHEPAKEPVEKTSIREEKAAETEEDSPKVRSRKPSGKDKLHLPVATSTYKTGRWSVGATVGNGGGMSLAGNEEGGAGMIQNSPGQRLNLAEGTGNGIISIPNDQMVVFKEGVPYLQQMDEVVDIKHHQPVSFGLSVRKGLAKGFSIETGLTYTLLSSDVKTAGSDAMLDQKLHYIGIPVRANWNFYDKNRFTLYVAAGGMVEKCVYGKRDNEKLTVNPLQFSVSGAIGAQFNATKHVGIYAEPGVAYFFNDGSAVQTIRKETPFNFNIQAGVRFTY